MSARVTTDQVREFLERDARDGLYDRFQQFLTGGNHDPLDQLWFAIGRPLQLAKTKEQYVAQFPARPGWETRVHRHHTLLLPVDPRASLTALTNGFRIQFNGTEETFEPWDAKEELPHWAQPHWMWCQPGPWFFNWQPQKVRSEDCAVKEYSCSALEGLHIWGLTGPYPFVTDCPRSVRRGGRQFCACLELWVGGPGLGWCWGERAGPDGGAASRGE